MATIIRDKIKQPDGKDFKLLDAIDVEHIYKDEYGAEQVTSVKDYLDNLTDDIKTNKSNIASLGDTYYTEAEIDVLLIDKADVEHTHEEYLEASDISGLATEKYVIDKIEEAKLAESDVDLSSYYTKTEVDTKVREEIEAIEHPTVDLSPYATTEYVDGKVVEKANVADVYNKTDANNTFLAKADIETTFSSYAKTAEVETELGKKVDSETYNTDKAAFAVKTDIDTELAKKVDITTYNTDKATFALESDLEGLASEEYVTTKIAEAKLAASDVDLSSYYTKTETDTEIQTKIETAINAIEHPTVDLTSYATTEYVDVELDKKSDATHTHEDYLSAIANKADKTELHNHDNKAVLDSITSLKIESWDNKSDFSGAYADLEGAPNITENNSGDLVIADKDGNIIFRSDGAGFETTTLTAQKVMVNGTDVEVELNRLDSHISDTIDEDGNSVCANPHVKDEERIAWNAKATTQYVDEKVASKADKTELHNHSNKTELDKIIEGKVDEWDAKADSEHTHEEYVVKETGKGLSTNDFTADYKAKLEGIAEGANKTIVDSALSETSENPVQNKAVNTAITNLSNIKVDKVEGWRLISPSEITKLSALTVDTESGDLAISGTVSAGNVEGLGELLDTKVDKVTGKDLSSNDYTTAEKNKLGSIEEGATRVIVDSTLSETSTNAIQNKTVNSEINGLKALINVNTEAINNIAHPVSSVNGKTGDVVLSASDVGALPNTTVIPSIDGLATEGYVNEQFLTKADKSYVDDQLNTKVNTNDVYNKTEADNKFLAKTDIETTLVSYAKTEDIEASYVAKSDLATTLESYAKTSDIEATLFESYYTKSDIDNKGYAVAEEVAETYVTKQDLAAHSNTMDAKLEDYAKSDDVEEALAKKIENAEILHTTETISEGATITDGKLSIVVDAYTKAETLNKIQEKITEVNGGESAGEVLSQLTSYMETNNSRVGDIETKNTSQDNTIILIQESIDTLNANVETELQKKVDVEVYNEDKNTFALKSELHEHSNKTVLDNINSEKVSYWDNKSDFSGAYDDLVGAPDIKDDETGEFNISDESGNVVLRVDKEGLETTVVAAKKVEINGTDVESKLNILEDHISDITDSNNSDAFDENLHVKKSEREAWNAKATTQYVDDKVATKADSEHEHEEYVVKETGKGLSTNDFTADYKAKLEGIAEGANKIIVDSALSETSENPVQNKAVNTAITNLSNIKVDKVEGWRLISPSEITKLSALTVDTESGDLAISGTVSAGNVEGLGELLDTKVDKVTGKGLSSNDFTEDYKIKLEGIETGATKVIVDTALSETSTNAIQNKAVNAAIENLSNAKVDNSTLNSYYTKDYINNSYYTKNEIDNKKYAVAADVEQVYATKQELIAKADKEHLHDEYVVKETNKGLSTNDFSSEYKTKLDGIAEGANKVIVDTTLSETSANAIQNKVVAAEAKRLENLIKANTDAIPSIDGLATTQYVDEKVATKADKSELHNHSNKTELDKITDGKVDAWDAKADKSYVDIQLDNKANVTDVYNKIEANNTFLAKADIEATLEPYAKTEEVARDYATKQELTDHTHTIDTALSDVSENPVQNKIINSEISNLKTLISGNTEAINNITHPISSVNGQTGAVVLSASDVGALPNTTEIPSIEGLVTTEYVNGQLDNKADKSDVYNKTDANSTFLAKTEVETTLEPYAKTTDVEKKVGSAEISHTTEEIPEGATIVDGKLSIVVDAYTKAETLTKIQEKITEINGGESAGEVLGALNSYIETNNSRVGAIETKNTSQDTAITSIQTSVDALNTNIKVNDSGMLEIADESENVILKVDENGLETTTVTAKALVVDTIKINTIEDSIEDIIKTYILNVDYSKLEFDTTEIVVGEGVL